MAMGPAANMEPTSRTIKSENHAGEHVWKGVKAQGTSSNSLRKHKDFSVLRSCWILWLVWLVWFWSGSGWSGWWVLDVENPNSSIRAPSDRRIGGFGRQKPQFFYCILYTYDAADE